MISPRGRVGTERKKERKKGLWQYDFANQMCLIVVVSKNNLNDQKEEGWLVDKAEE